MAPQCLKCSKPVYMSDEVRFEGSLYHQKCINCTKCHKSLNIFSLKRIEQDFYCESCYKSAAPDAATKSELLLSKQTGVPASSSSNLKSATAPKGDICPVCSKPVYFAESITAVSRDVMAKILVPKGVAMAKEQAH
ncbi:LOW QUALITY PROTEIN: hypothetical protein MXB_1011 [Myxobolus squamalis]|nr:LOW QUALITY PROTEIN: hypothetical protein MXB_1011 [Myxobolus squamalis]